MPNEDIKYIFDRNKFDEHKFDYKTFMDNLFKFKFIPEDIYVSLLKFNL